VAAIHAARSFTSDSCVVAEAGRELAEFVYVAWQAEEGGERAAALRDGRRCLATPGTYLGLLEGLGDPAEQ